MRLKICLFKSVICLTLLNAVSGCSFSKNFWLTDSSIENPTPVEAFQSPGLREPQPNQNRVPNQELDLPHFSSVEVLWTVPSVPVDRYTIRYGASADSLTISKTVEVAHLEIINDAHLGSVFRYVLEGVPAKESVFVSLIAHRGDDSSMPSKAFEVPPKLGY